jgi:transposase
MRSVTSGRRSRRIEIAPAHALALIGELFRIERDVAQAPPEAQLRVRQAQSKPIVDAFFTWCDAEAPVVLDETPISRGIGYACDQRRALERFLDDGRLPAHNNWSERELRREAIGRKNRIFLGSDDGGDVNATFVTLLASCQLHGIEPWAYLRDLLCLLPSWPRRHVFDLVPADWNKTAQQQDAQQRLAANIFRPVTFGVGSEHRQDK